MEIKERLQVFLERLNALPPFASHDEALAAIDRVMTAVEDELSGISRDSTGMPEFTDGRMYPPVSAYFKLCDLPGVTLYVQKQHLTYISDTGAVLIVSRRTGSKEFEKADGSGTRINP